uniref:EF-hand domain-containing protein n=1 Tax=Chromera velia CCMP2878 TaxID=1169474 RepID=A0A0G4I492_9ALVE|eukprot:Cvel_10866.t1-p1 / transcript=Cvel_10866.t1 / gene=Cvel_10866 / organism=Chromera_velia_CCMP2878 / gene_product=Caltractin ICL1d, putative / transcript_product=Caltractin ICL1d, putative / location=Cvel_scaffold666:464-6979(-) / protein_length=180 / sequence_SO=supercontig / SO=protein_coding / is_pseudo=false
MSSPTKVGMGSTKKENKTFNPKNYERPGLKQDEIEEIKNAFDMFDADGSGTIDPKEMRQVMKELGYEAKSEVIFEMIAQLDKDGTQQLSFEKFLNMMTAPDTKDSKEDIHKIFKLFDIEDKGRIGIKELARVAKELGGKCSSETAAEMTVTFMRRPRRMSARRSAAFSDPSSFMGDQVER